MPTGNIQKINFNMEQDNNQEFYDGFVNAVKKREGCVSIIIEKEMLLDPDPKKTRLFHIIVGANIFVLERTHEKKLRYFYASPGTGTRVCWFDFNKNFEDNVCEVKLYWPPNDVKMEVYTGTRVAYRVISCLSIATYKTFKHNPPNEYGSKLNQVWGFHIISQGKVLVEPCGLEYWSETKEAVRAFEDCDSKKPKGNYLYEVTRCAASITAIVTGWETYCRKRFSEMEEEGLIPNEEELSSWLFSKDKELKEAEAREKAKEDGFSFTKYLAEKKIQFQNYKKCSLAFSKAYKLDFSQILTTDEIDELKNFIKYRHEVVHVSITKTTAHTIKEWDKFYAGEKLRARALQFFDSIIFKINDATLRIK